MVTIDTKNYKKYLIASDKATVWPKKSKDKDFTDQLIVIDQNDPNLLSISNSNGDGSWSTTNVTLEGQSKDNIRKISDAIAQQIFTKNVSKLKKLKIKEVTVKDRKKYTFAGSNSIKELVVDIHSSESEDDSLLHFLLGRVKSA